MTKNKKSSVLLRVALILCVVALFFSSFVAVTFAKYVTGEKSEDFARVSRWGVTISVAKDSDGNSQAQFYTSYAAEDSDDASVLSVISQTGEAVVAPGTSGDTLRFTLAGTPEVATQVIVNMTINKDIYLKTTDGDALYGINDNYYPVVFTLNQVKGESREQIAKGNLAAIKAAVDNYSGTKYAPNTNLEAVFELSWEWAFDVSDTNNSYDTALANLAVGDTSDPTYNSALAIYGAGDSDALSADGKYGVDGNWCVYIDYEIEFLVTQTN